MSYARALADHLCALSYSAAPEEIRERVRTVVLYNLAIALAACDGEDPVGAALKAVAGAPGGASLIGSDQKRAAADAAFVNAALVAARGQNDTYPALVAHVGCVIVPAALAVAQEHGATGAQTLSAILAGYEAIAKIGHGVAAAVNARGFRSTPVFGVFGAASAAARVLGLRPEAIANALAIAANFSSGILQCWADGTSEWRIQVAHASRAGVTAALLAEHELDGAPRTFEGANGFFRAFAGIVPELDLSRWSITEIAFKPYPGCAFNQAPVHALRKFLARERVQPGDVDRIDVYMHPDQAEYPGVAAHGPFEAEAGAIMSAPLMLAATLRDGAPVRRHFTRDRNDASLTKIARRIEVHGDAKVAPWQCCLRLGTGTGRAFEFGLDEPKPFVLDWRQTVDLLKSLATESGKEEPSVSLSSLVRAVETLEGATDVGALIEACERA